MASPTQNLALFVDVNNVYHGCMRKYNRRLDYRMFIEYMKYTHGSIQVAYAYGMSDDEGVESFKSLLRHAGYECRWSDVPRYNWNVGIAMDVVRQCSKVDLIILGSGDPYLAPCAEYVRQQGLKCYSYGFRISDGMKRGVDRWFEIPESLLINAETVENETSDAT